MSSGRQAGGQVWVSYSDCDKHICTEGGPCKVCRITKLETQIKAVKGCDIYSGINEANGMLEEDFMRVKDVFKALEQSK